MNAALIFIIVSAVCADAALENVTLPLEYHGKYPFVRVNIDGASYKLLVNMSIDVRLLH